MNLKKPSIVQSFFNTPPNKKMVGSKIFLFFVSTLIMLAISDNCFDYGTDYSGYDIGQNHVFLPAFWASAQQHDGNFVLLRIFQPMTAQCVNFDFHAILLLVERYQRITS